MGIQKGGNLGRKAEQSQKIWKEKKKKKAELHGMN